MNRAPWSADTRVCLTVADTSLDDCVQFVLQRCLLLAPPHVYRVSVPSSASCAKSQPRCVSRSSCQNLRHRGKDLRSDKLGMILQPCSDLTTTGVMAVRTHACTDIMPKVVYHYVCLHVISSPGS